MRYIQGYFRVTFNKVTYYVSYERSKEPDGHGLRGGRIQALHVTDGERDVLRYENHKWEQAAQTADEQSLLTIIIERVH